MVINFGFLVVTRQQNALATQRLIYAAVIVGNNAKETSMITRLILIFLILILSLSEIISQETESIKFADEMPLFLNDNTGQKFLDYIFQNLDLSDLKTIENGKVIVQFIVKTDSLITDVKIVKGLNAEI